MPHIYIDVKNAKIIAIILPFFTSLYNGGIIPERKENHVEKAISVEKIEGRIYQIRGKRVMLDKDLAELYEVETRVLNQAVKRNINRFPEDFMFALSREEIARISQFVTSLKFYKPTSIPGHAAYGG